LYFFIWYFVSFHFCVVLLLLRTFVAFINKIIIIVNTRRVERASLRKIQTPEKRKI